MKSNFLISIILLLFVSCSVKENEISRKSSYLSFEVKQMFVDKDDLNLDLLLRIPNNVLVFRKLIDNFESNLTIDVSILDHNNEFVYSQSSQPLEQLTKA